MKKSLFLMAAAALVMSACTQDVAEQDGFGADYTGAVKISATSQVTRTAITAGEDALEVSWIAGEDQIGIFAYDESELATTNAAYTAAESGSYSTFTTTGDAIQWGEGSHDFYAYYPYTGDAMHQTAVYANVPAVQEQSEAGNLAHIAPLAFMYASQTDVVKSAAGVDFSFQNAFSVVAVNLCSEAGTINCGGVIFRAAEETEVVTGTNVCVNLTDGSLSYDSSETSNQVQVNLTTPATLDAENAQTIYALITPGHAGKTFEAIALVDGVEVSLGTFAIPASGIPASALAVLNVNVPEPQPVDLSANGTANTYIVPALGKYSFKATVKGNGRTGEVGCGRWNESGVHTFVNGAAANNTQTSVDLAPASAELLWYQSWNSGYKQYVVDCPIDPASVALVDGNIEFKTAATFIPGNAVIAAKDAEGKIIWSWHIWVSEGYNPEATAVNTGTYGLIAMDRNIGANIADFTKTDDGWVAAQAVGMLYQWGRKDPFPGPLEISDDTADGNRGGVGYGAMAADGTLMYGSNGPEGSGEDRGYIAIKNTEYLHGLVQDAGLSGDWTYTEAVAYANANPHRLIHNRDRSGNNYNYDWWGTRNDAAKAQILYVWGAPGWKQYTKNALKTIYDPCPAGWIVPSSDFGNVASGLEGEAMVQRENYGWSIVTSSGNKLYFPRTGVRWGDATNFQNCNTLGAYWTSLMSDLHCAAYNFVDKDGAFAGVSHINGNDEKKVAESVEGNSAHSMGISTRAIRCVKESNAFVPSEPVEPEPEPEVVDLSATATSNCYIVNAPATEYKFKATVKGNGYAPMAGETAEIAPTKARMLWAQSGMTMTAGDGDDAWPSGLGDAGALDMIDYTTVELKDGYVHFTTGEEMVNGNAVIAVTNDEGTILWSWHLWMLNDYDPAVEDYYVTTNNTNVYMMDRNLGATATPKNGVDTNNEWLGARGYYYQWGRKDPFASHNAKWNGYETRIYVYDENGEPQKYDAEGNPSAEGEVDWIYVKYSGYTAFPRVSASNIPNAGDVYASVAYAVANPMTYLTGGASYMWTAGTDEHIVSGATNEWGKLWGNQKEGYSRWDKEGVKTMYDPCPAGYRVPGPGHFAFVTAHNDDAGAGYNSMAAWKYNCVEKLFDEAGNKNYPDGMCQGNAPYGLHFYVKGSKTADPNVAEGAQNYGVAPEDATTAYFPAQGFFNWSASERTANGESPNIYAHTNAVKNASWYGYSTYFLQAEAQGEFFTCSGSVSYGEQQAKAMPVRCFRE
ncbi:MAG: fimbrillin family protein [Rikenellaceae bacterium]|nr:fimbrillin family protein [Rikenellaceae bacterium]